MKFSKFNLLSVKLKLSEGLDHNTTKLDFVSWKRKLNYIDLKIKKNLTHTSDVYSELQTKSAATSCNISLESASCWKEGKKGTVYHEWLNHMSMLEFLFETLQRPMSGIWHKQPTTKVCQCLCIHQWRHRLRYN